MTSRFFMSDSESESSSDSQDFVKEQVGISAGISAFTFSDDEEDKKRVVRSAKEKRYEELNNIIKNMKNFRKNKDMASLLGGFEDICKAYQKALPVIMKEEGGRTPRFYLRCLVELETFLNQIWEDKDARKVLSKNNTKSLTTLRQKYRKYTRDFEQDIIGFKEKPDEESDSEEEEEVEEDDQSEDEEILSFKKEPSLPKEEKAVDESDYSSDWPSDSDESSSSEEEKRPGQLATRDHFLKKPETEDKHDKAKKDKTERKRVRREQKEESDDEEGWQKVHKHAMPVEKPKMFAKDDEITVSAVIKKLHEVMAARGKKGTDRREQIELLNELRKISEEKDLGNGILIKIRINNIMSSYDYSVSVFDPMKADLWEKVLNEIEALLDLLKQTLDLAIGDHITEEAESLEKPPYRVRGCILTIVDRCDEEFIKFLKAADAHSNDYVIRLRDEVKICHIINKLLLYIEDTGMPADKCRIYLRKIEHIYYKYDVKSAQQVKGEIPPTEPTSLTEMDKLCKYIYITDNTDRLRTRAVLCHIYHMSLHDKWFEARDLMLMAHLQETIHFSDLPTQILYNRTMVQIGLCAFRHGNIKDAHNALLDIQSGGRAKELLAQGLIPQRQHERTTEQEKQEKQRQIPFHQHINLEMLECVYLVSAMLIEIPYMAAHEFDARRRLISKSFHHQLKNSERQALVGPPESMREHVVAASKAMRNGNWEACRNLLLNKKMRTKVWDLFHNTETVTSMLDKKIREESLRTYLFTYSYVYDSISLVTLTETFSLPYSSVHAVISKMIINEEIMASLDEPTSCLVMHRTEPSSMQSLSLQLADKMYNLVDNNEKLLDQRPYFNRNMQSGNYRQKTGWNDRRDRRN